MKSQKLILKFVFTIILLVVFNVQNVSAQKPMNHRISGKVMFQGETVKDVEVKLFIDDNSFIEQKTKANGKVVFKADCQKSYSLLFEKEGYVSKRLVINTSNPGSSDYSLSINKFLLSLEKQEAASYYSDNNAIPYFDF